MNHPGFYFDEVTGRYFAVPRTGGRIPPSTEKTQRLQRQINEQRQQVSPVNANIEKFRKQADESMENIRTFVCDTDPLLNKKWRNIVDNETSQLKDLKTLSKLPLSLQNPDVIIKYQNVDFYREGEQSESSPVKLFYRHSKDLVYEIRFLFHDIHAAKLVIPYYTTGNSFELCGNSLDESHLSSNYIASVGLNITTGLLDYEQFVSMCKSYGLRRSEHHFRSLDDKIQSDITFCHLTGDFQIFGFRDGSVLIRNTKVVQHQTILQTGSSVCSARIIYSTGLTFLVVAGIQNRLVSFAYNPVSFDWTPFMEYTGYCNKAKLDDLMKIDSHPSFIKRNRITDRIFAVITYDEFDYTPKIICFDVLQKSPLISSGIQLETAATHGDRWFLINGYIFYWLNKSNETRLYKLKFY